MKTKSTETSRAGLPELGLKGEFFLIIFLCFGILTAVVLGSVGSTAKATADDVIRTFLANGTHVLKTRLNSRFDTIEQAALTMAYDSRLRPLVYAGAYADLIDLAEELHKAQSFDILMIAGADGNLLVRTDKREEIGSSALKSGLVQKALQGQRAHGFMRKENELFQIVAVPIVDNVATDVVKGALLLAYALTPDLGSEISALTSSSVSFFASREQALDTRTKITLTDVFSTISASELRLQIATRTAESIEVAAASKDATSDTVTVTFPVKVDSGSDEFVALLYPLRAYGGAMIGYLGAYRSRAEVLKPFRRILRDFAAIGAVCLLLGMILAYFVADRVSKPVVELTAVAKEIEDGGYPVPKEKPRNAEIGRLYAAIFKMGQALRRKTELEDYLAGFTEEISEVNEFTESMSTIEEVPHEGASFKRKQLANGKVVDGRYRILRLLGKGGMGTVYLAQDTELDESIALKVLDSRSMGEGDVDALKHELKLARRIAHHNVVKTFDFGASEGLHYITMEHVAGFTLRKFVEQRGPLALSPGLLMLRQICSAVHAAHIQGIIHRDLKADNIMISKRGALKVMDFGIAATLGQQPAPVNGDTERKGGAEDLLHMIVGTPAYMAPEQFTSAPVDERVDVYALGVILFFLFTSKFPFKGRNFVELALQHRKATPPDIATINPGLPQNLNAVFQRAVAKERTERYSSVKELSSALEQLST